MTVMQDVPAACDGRHRRDRDRIRAAGGHDRRGDPGAVGSLGTTVGELFGTANTELITYMPDGDPDRTPADA